MTASTDPDRLPWWRYAGPWPLRPWAMLVLIGMIHLAVSADDIRVETLTRYAIGIALASVVGFAILWSADRFLQPFVRNPLGYLTVIIILGISLSIVRYATGTQVEYDRLSDTADFAASVTRNVVVALIILAILGVNSRRLQFQVDQTQHALSLVRSQAEALLAADETVRQQVATALHDRVQAGLIGACLQLQSALPHVDERESSLITKVIDSLEELRALDVRRAVRSLSPNLREVDFQSALEDLTETYSPGMVTSLDIAVPSAPYEARLGAYRIIEQSLLNSAMHGHARHCDVSLRETDGLLLVTITDDGVGLPAVTKPGLGSTLISTWCRTLDGSWTRESLETGGTIVTAQLSLST